MLKKILIICLLLQNINACQHWREYLAMGLVVANLSLAFSSFMNSSNCHYNVNQLVKHHNDGQSILLEVIRSKTYCNSSYYVNIVHFASFLVFILYISYVIKRNLRIQRLELHPRAHVNENMP